MLEIAGRDRRFTSTQSADKTALVDRCDGWIGRRIEDQFRDVADAPVREVGEHVKLLVSQRQTQLGALGAHLESHTVWRSRPIVGRALLDPLDKKIESRLVTS